METIEAWGWKYDPLGRSSLLIDRRTRQWHYWEAYTVPDLDTHVLVVFAGDKRKEIRITKGV